MVKPRSRINTSSEFSRLFDRGTWKRHIHIYTHACMHAHTHTQKQEWMHQFLHATKNKFGYKRGYKYPTSHFSMFNCCFAAWKRGHTPNMYRSCSVITAFFLTFYVFGSCFSTVAVILLSDFFWLQKVSASEDIFWTKPWTQGEKASWTARKTKTAVMAAH